MKEFKVVSYKSTDRHIHSVRKIFEGTYDECLKFYIENKAKYRCKNELLELMYNN